MPRWATRPGVRPAGRPRGRPPKLGPREEALLLAMLRRQPYSYGFTQAAWTLAMMAAVMYQEHGILVDKATLGRHLDDMFPDHPPDGEGRALRAPPP